MNQAIYFFGRVYSFFGPEKYDFHRCKRLLWKKMALKWSQMLKNKILIARFLQQVPGG
jgi:hypothetical protein